MDQRSVFRSPHSQRVAIEVHFLEELSLESIVEPDRLGVPIGANGSTFLVDLMVPARVLIVLFARVANLEVIVVLERENVTSSVAALFVEDGARLVLAVPTIRAILNVVGDGDVGSLVLVSHHPVEGAGACGVVLEI